LVVSEGRTGRKVMKLLYLEMKRMLSVKRIRIVLILAVCLSILLSYLPVTFESVSYTEATGNIFELKGIEAVRYKKNLQKDIAGIVTDQKVRMAVEECQKVFHEYGVRDYYELPDEVYVRRILPFIPLVKGVREVFADPSTGMAPDILEIDAAEIEDYYVKCEEWVASLMKIEQKDNFAAQDFAIRMYHNVEKPYLYYPGTSRNAMDYQILLALGILILCTVISAPGFSSDYQTRAHDIFCTTRKGGTYYGNIKIAASILVCSGVYLVCMALYLIISNCLFGWECTKTSVQMIYSIVNLPDFNIGELQIAIGFGGLLSVWAAMSITLYFSSISRNTVVSLSLGFALCILPLFVYIIIPDKVGLWMNCILPSGGVCLQTSYLFQLIDFQFLNIGGQAVWIPYVMAAFAIAEIPLFLVITIRCYLNYKVS